MASILDREQYLKIGRPRAVCIACGAPIAAAGKHPTLLLAAGAAHESDLPADAAAVAGAAADDGEAAAPRRFDYCGTCWAVRRAAGTAAAAASIATAPPSATAEASPPESIGFWLTTREAPKPRKIQNKKQRNTALLSLFELLHRTRGREHAARLYYIAHLLMKYNVLKWHSSQHAGAEAPDAPSTLTFRNPATDEHFIIEDLPLPDELALEIQKQLDEYLTHTEAPPAPAPAPYAS